MARDKIERRRLIKWMCMISTGGWLGFNNHGLDGAISYYAAAGNILGSSR